MCRLLGYVTRTPTTLAELLGEPELFQFTELSCKHGDGWGFAWATGDGTEVRKAPDAARTSEDFSRYAHTHRADLGLVHLRWATGGLSVTPENTHPFTDGRIAFAHNGWVQPAAALDSLVPADVRRLRQGTTDSERYFLATLARAREATPAAALAQTAEAIARSYEISGLNALLATPDELVALCYYDSARQAKHEEFDYYHLRYRVTPDAVVVSSSGWGAGWRTLRNGEMLVVDRATLGLSVTSVAAAASSRGSQVA